MQFRDGSDEDGELVAAQVALLELREAVADVHGQLGEAAGRDLELDETWAPVRDRRQRVVREPAAAAQPEHPQARRAGEDVVERVVGEGQPRGVERLEVRAVERG